MVLNYRVIVERYPIPNGVVGGSIPIVKFSFSLTKKLARWVGSQELTHCKIDGKYHLAPRGFLSRVGPTDSNSRRTAQHWLVVYLRINWGGSMTISYPNQSHTNLSRSSTYNDQDINSRSIFYNKIITIILKKYSLCPKKIVWLSARLEIEAQSQIFPHQTFYIKKSFVNTTSRDVLR